MKEKARTIRCSTQRCDIFNHAVLLTQKCRKFSEFGDWCTGGRTGSSAWKGDECKQTIKTSSRVGFCSLCHHCVTVRILLGLHIPHSVETLS